VHAHCGSDVGDVVGWRRGRAVEDVGGLGLRAVCGSAAFFDDGVEFTDGFVDISFRAAERTRAG
jgi:hypothetical protein